MEVESGRKSASVTAPLEGEMAVIYKNYFLLCHMNASLCFTHHSDLW